MRRFDVHVDVGLPRGDLYMLEQVTYYRVVDVATGEVLMAFQGEMEASLSVDTGTWEDYRFYGVSGVAITPDEQWAIVHHHDGHQEKRPLPKSTAG